MLRYVNIARQQPSYFMSIINNQLDQFLNQRQLPINEQIIYQTNEGKDAWLEALNFLKGQQPLSPLQYHQGLALAASDHAKDLANNSMLGHTGSDGSSFSNRILKYCRKGHGSMAQLIGADFYFPDRNHAEMTVLGLIVDDGVPDRGHRKTIFNPAYKCMGCKSQTQGEKLVTVFNLTENYLTLRGQQSSISPGGSFGVSNVSPLQSPERRDSQQQRSSNGNRTQMSYTNEKISDIAYDPRVQSPNRVQYSPPLANSSHYPNRNQRFDSGNIDMKAQTRSVFNDQRATSPSHLSYSPSRLNATSPTGGFNAARSLVGSIAGRRIAEKKQSSQIYYEDNMKITQTTTKLIYSDGTQEEKVDRQTVYLFDE